MKNNKNETCIVIGTSPVSLLEALHLHKLGNKVQIVEKGDQIGGVWAVDEFHGLTGIERYCHILTYNREGYRAMKKLFPGRYANMEIQPVMLGFVKETEIRNFSENFLSVLLKYRGKPELYNRIVNYRLNYIAHLYDWLTKSMFGVRNIYPAKGIHDILSVISSAIEEAGIPILFNCDVKSILISSKNGPVHLSVQDREGNNLDTLISDTVVIPTRAVIKEFVLGDQKIDLHDDLRKRRHAQIFLMIGVDKKSQFSYIHFSRHNFLRRIHNLTPHVRLSNELPADREIHIVEVKPEFLEAGGAINTVMKSLSGLDLISPDYTMIDSSAYLREIPEPNKEGVSSVRRFCRKNVVQFLWTRDFSRAIGLHYPRWRKTINSF